MIEMTHALEKLQLNIRGVVVVNQHYAGLHLQLERLDISGLRSHSRQSSFPRNLSSAGTSALDSPSGTFGLCANFTGQPFAHAAGAVGEAVLGGADGLESLPALRT
jgi:hypothetical protein